METYYWNLFFIYDSNTFLLLFYWVFKICVYISNLIYISSTISVYLVPINVIQSPCFDEKIQLVDQTYTHICPINQNILFSSVMVKFPTLEPASLSKFPTLEPAIHIQIPPPGASHTHPNSPPWSQPTVSKFPTLEPASLSKFPALEPASLSKFPLWSQPTLSKFPTLESAKSI